MSKRFEGKVGILTGGAKGIGRMISEALLQAGARVYISSRSADDCHALTRDLRALKCRKLSPRFLQLGLRGRPLELQIKAHGGFVETDLGLPNNVNRPVFLVQESLDETQAAENPLGSSSVVDPGLVFFPLLDGAGALCGALIG